MDASDALKVFNTEGPEDRLKEIKAQQKNAHQAVTEEMKEEAKGLDTLLKQLTTQKRSTRVTALAAKKKLDKIRLDRGMLADGFAAAIDTIMNKYGADRAVYHGGDLNGNGSRRLMGSAGGYFDKLKQASLLVKEPNSVLMEDKIRMVFDKYKKMYLLADQIYSLFQDVLPSEADLEWLEKANELCRVLWMNLGISVTPKMHLLFDGESFAQYKRLKGIGDTEEDFVEKGHQLSMRNNRRTWNMRNWEQQQLSQV